MTAAKRILDRDDATRTIEVQSEGEEGSSLNFIHRIAGFRPVADLHAAELGLLAVQSRLRDSVLPAHFGRLHLVFGLVQNGNDPPFAVARPYVFVLLSCPKNLNSSWTN